MAEASPPWKPAASQEPERALAIHVSSVCVVLPPTRVPKKRRVDRRSSRHQKDEQMTLSPARELVPSNALHSILKPNERREQEQFRTARQRFVPDSEDEEPSFSSVWKAVPLPPKLVTSKSEGRANALPSRRRQLLQQQLPQSTRPGTQAAVQVQGQLADAALSTGDIRLTREKMVRRYCRNPEHKRSCGSLTSVSSHEPSGAAAGALGRGFLSSTTCSSSTILMDEMLVAVAQRAKKQLEAVSKRQVMEEGRWKRIARSKPECQSFESVSKAKDQYSVMVEVDLPCSLREIMSVFSTDNSAEFHRSMEAIFGDQYVYGVNIRTADCASFVGGANSTLRSRPRARRASVPATWHGHDGPISTNALPLRSAKLNVNAISLMQKHHLVWKQRSMTFMDYLEEDIETKSVTRVIQTMDMQDEDLEYSSITVSSPTATSSSQEGHFQRHTQHGIDLHQELKGILAGYIIQEDSGEKLTRVFFYATHHHHPSGRHGQTRMPRSAVQLLRAMVNKVCRLETVVLRRRLGYYPLTRLPSCSDGTAMASCCVACYVPFNMLRKRHFCRLCGQYTCRKCSDVQEVEKTVGLVEKHRVCASCVRRVSCCVFSMCVFPSKIASNASWTSIRSQRPTVEDDGSDPPIMDDLASNDFEHVEDLHSNQSEVFGGFVSDFQDKKRGLDFQWNQDFAAQQSQNLAAKRRQRLQLSIDDLSTWAPGSFLDDQNTPKESISILDSFCDPSPRSLDLPS